MLFASVIFCLVAGSVAVSVEPGPCPNVTVNKIDLVDYSGIWFKSWSTENEYDELQECVKLRLYLPENGVSTLVTTSTSADTGNHLEIESKLTVNKKDRGLYADHSVPLLGKVKTRYWNVAVNLDKYAVSWACENQGRNHVKAITVYTRERQLSKKLLEEARKESAKNGVVLSGLLKYNQKNCD